MGCGSSLIKPARSGSVYRHAIHIHNPGNYIIPPSCNEVHLYCDQVWLEVGAKVVIYYPPVDQPGTSGMDHIDYHTIRFSEEQLVTVVIPDNRYDLLAPGSRMSLRYTDKNSILSLEVQLGDNFLIEESIAVFNSYLKSGETGDFVHNHVTGSVLPVNR